MSETKKATPGFCDNCHKRRVDVTGWMFAGREWLLICRQCREPKPRCEAVRVAPGASGLGVEHRCTKDTGHRGQHDGGFGSWRWS